MKLDQLPMEMQETAIYCYSCGEVCNEDDLGECLTCGYRICGLVANGCSGRCACDEALKEKVFEAITNLEGVKAGIEMGFSVPMASLAQLLELCSMTQTAMAR